MHDIIVRLISIRVAYDRLGMAASVTYEFIFLERLGGIQKLYLPSLFDIVLVCFANDDRMLG